MLEYGLGFHKRPAVTSSHLVFVLIGVLACGPGWAEDGASIRESVQRTLDAHAAGLPGQVSTEIGPIAQRERHQRCTNWSSALQTSSRAWGKVSLYVRCTEGLQASLYVSANIRVTGRYVASARAITAGQLLSMEDLQMAEGELSRLPADTLLSTDQATGRRSRMAISATQPLRASLLRDDFVVHAGQEVQVQAASDGFTVANTGRALDSGAPGSPVRVRLPSGQIVEGTAKENGAVRVRH